MFVSEKWKKCWVSIGVERGNEMLSRERIKAVLNGKQADCIPIFPKISHATCKFVDGMTMREYMTNPEAMAEAIILGANKFGWDAVGIVTDIANEGMALGSKYIRPENATSQLIQYFLSDLDDYEKIQITDPWLTEPTKTILKATEIVKKEIGNHIFVTSWCNAPLNVASQLLPMETLLLGMIEESEKVHCLLQRCLNYTMNYVKCLVAAGADAVSFGHAMASSNVISPAYYEEFALPYEKKLVETIHNEGAAAITHICGNIEKIIPKINDNGTDIIDVDASNDIVAIAQKSKKVLRGNISPVLLANGTAQEVYNETARVVKLMKESGKFILGTGCEMTAVTPTENIEAFVRAGRDFGNL